MVSPGPRSAGVIVSNGNSTEQPPETRRRLAAFLLASVVFVFARFGFEIVVLETFFGAFFGVDFVTSTPSVDPLTP